MLGPQPYPKKEETEEKTVFPPVRPRLRPIDLKLMSGLPVPLNIVDQAL